MKLSVIIPCYNAEKTLGVQLSALAAQRWSDPWEVIVADNRSTDRSRLIAESYRNCIPNLRVVDAPEKVGTPWAINKGAQAARGEYLAFCDADDEVAPGWLAAMGKALSTYDFVACRIDLRKLNPPWVFRALGDHQQTRGLQKNWYPPYLPHAGGGTLGIRRSLHEAVGGFDEELLYLNDTDYCFRLQLAGVALHFVPEAVAYIRCRHRLKDLFHQARHWAEHSVKLYVKYQGFGSEISEPWTRYFLKWRRLLSRIPRVRRKGDYALLVWQMGWQVGLLHGSIKYRAVPVPV